MRCELEREGARKGRPSLYSLRGMKSRAEEDDFEFHGTDVTALYHRPLLRRLCRMVEPKDSRGWALMQPETSTMRMEAIVSQQLAVPLRQ